MVITQLTSKMVPRKVMRLRVRWVTIAWEGNGKLVDIITSGNSELHRVSCRKLSFPKRTWSSRWSYLFCSTILSRGNPKKVLLILADVFLSPERLNKWVDYSVCLDHLYLFIVLIHEILRLGARKYLFFGLNARVFGCMCILWIDLSPEIYEA